jgi:RND family efflux transporter MFP subunit
MTIPKRDFFEKMKRSKSAFKIAAFVSLGILALLVLIPVFLKQAEAPEPFLAPVITIKPLRGRLEKTIRISSQVETGRLITLVPRVGGTLIFLDAQPGRMVAENEIIAQVDSAPYDLAYLQAQAAFLTARSTYERVSGLFQNQAATRQNYEEVRTAYEAARAQYEMAQLNLDYTRIRSPLNGVVLMKHSAEGGLVDSRTPLATLGDLADLRIKAAVPEIHYKFFAENWETMPVSMTVPALDTPGAAPDGAGTAARDAAGGDLPRAGGSAPPYAGRFTLEPLSLAPYVSPANRSFLVEYRIPGGAEQSLRPGMFVNVSFVLDRREDVYYLPFTVMASGDRLWYVDEEGRAKYIEFTPHFFNDDYFQIPEELGNTTFISEGQHFISPGQELNILSVADGSLLP